MLERDNYGNYIDVDVTDEDIAVLDLLEEFGY